MVNRPAILLRTLAAITALEAILCVYEIVKTALVYDYPLKAFLSSNQKTLPYFMIAANIAFTVFLVVSAILLWAIQKAGLTCLLWTIVSEAAYAAIIIVSGAFAGLVSQGRTPNADLPIWGAASVGNAAVIAQLSTAYPLVAVALIFLGYRSLRQTTNVDPNQR